MTEQPESREATNPTGFYILPSSGFDYVKLSMNNLSNKSNVLVFLSDIPTYVEITIWIRTVISLDAEPRSLNFKM